MRFPKVSTTNINGLPLGYTEVEYLEGTGTQYIDTEYIPNNNSEIEIICNSGGVQGTNLFGYRNASANSKNITITTSSTGTAVFYTIDFNNSNYATYRYNYESNANQILKLKLSKSERSVYNTSETLLGGNSVSCPDVFTCNSTAYLMNVAGTPFFTECFKGKVYSCKIGESGVLVRDFIPCLDLNNRPCMYDKVEGKAYYNVGTDEFSYGRKIYGVEYLESSTTNARISTGILLDTFPFTAKVSVSSKAEYNSFYQVIVGTTNSTNQYLIGLKSGDPDFTMKYNNVAKTVGVVPVADKKYEISTTLTSTNMTMNIDGTNYTYTQALTASNEEIGLFPQNYNASPMRIYNAQLIKNNTLVRDYVPIKDENDVGYMFDRVNHILYENKGTGAFVVGGDTLGKSKAKLIRTKTTVSGLPYRYTEVEYLQSSGTQWIDTGISGNNPNLKIEVNATTYEFGWMHNNDASGSWVCAFTFPSENKERVNYGNYNPLVKTLDCDRTVRKVRVFDFKSGFYIDGALIQAFTIENYSSLTPSLPLFARYDFYDSKYKANVNSSYKIYSAKLYDNNTLVRDYIPALDENDRPCMYDKVEGKPYYNQGTGEFSYGPKIIPVDYIQSSGTQYIDTGIANSYVVRIVTDLSISEADYGVDTLILGGRNLPSAAGAGFCIRATNNTFDSDYFGNRINVCNYSYDTWYHIDKNKNTCTINGISITHTPKTTIGTSSILLNGFTETDGTKRIYQKGSVKWADCQIYENDVLVRDYIPVKDENNNGYMFDKIGHTLYENKGTGSFVVGNEKILSKVRFIEDTSVISEYTKLKCLISSGTQYIDTGFIPTDDNFKFEGTLFSQNTSAYFGYRSTSVATTDGDMRWFFNFNDGRVAIRYGSGGSNSTLAFNPQINHNFYFDGNSLYIDGVNFLTISQKYSTPVYKSFYLFSVNTSGYYGSDIVKFVGKIYNWKIWDNNALIRDFIPVLRNSDNKPGMYDRVTKTFFTNKGTGEFTYETL